MLFKCFPRLRGLHLVDYKTMLPSVFGLNYIYYTIIIYVTIIMQFV